MIKLVVISHALVQEAARKRWVRLAENYPIDVTLLVPKEWHTSWFRDEQVYKTEPINEGNFKLIPMAVTNKRNWSRYFFTSIDAKLRSLKPDVIYVVHEETTLIHFQIFLYRWLWCPSAKIIFFSMNALGVPLKKWHQRLRWKWLEKGVEFVFVHYPGIEKCFREAGFKKPIYYQTQIGVDEEIFKPDDNMRDKVRDELGFGDKFVIGYAGRLTEEKGLDDLLKTLPFDGVDWALLLVGNGPMREEIEEFAEKHGWQKRIKLVGTVTLEDVPRYMRAMDCFFIGSKTYPHSKDSFPSVPVQAMACGVAVVASDCGAIPWQVQDCGLIFPEGDDKKLKEHLMLMATNDELRKDFALRGREMVLNRFVIKHINEDLYEHLKDLVAE